MDRRLCERCPYITCLRANGPIDDGAAWAQLEVSQHPCILEWAHMLWTNLCRHNTVEEIEKE